MPNPYTMPGFLPEWDDPNAYSEHLKSVGMIPQTNKMISMKEQLTTEQVAKVFAMYFGCECDTPFGVMRINQINISSKYKLWFTDDCKDNEKAVWANSLNGRGFKPSEIKLHLRPLSAISDEDAIEVAKGNGYIEQEHEDAACGHDKDSMIWHGKNWERDGLQYPAYQYLTKQGYAVPLYFAPGHPCNGMDAIQLGLALAIDSPKSVEP